jgi:RNA polymerase sigma-70 factor (ECF subfamily)
MTWVDELIMQYEAGSRQIEQCRDALRAELDPSSAAEVQTLTEMLSDMQYAMDWMRRGRRPDNQRGAERRDVYRQRELFSVLSTGANAKLSESERLYAIESLLCLSERERACWLLHMVHGLTYIEISERLGISKRTVQQYVERAKHKLH